MLPLPKAVPLHVQVAIAPFLLKEQAMSKTPRQPRPKVAPLSDRELAAAKHGPDSSALIITLPSIEMSGHARKNLDPLKIYSCITQTKMTKGGNYQVSIPEKDECLRIPAAAMIFIKGIPSAEKLEGGAKIIAQAEATYTEKLLALVGDRPSKVSRPGQEVIYHPTIPADLPVNAKPYFTLGRAHVVKLPFTATHGIQPFVPIDEEVESPFHAKMRGFYYEVPPAILAQIPGLAKAADDALWERLNDYFTGDAVEVPEVEFTSKLTAGVKITEEVIENLPIPEPTRTSAGTEKLPTPPTLEEYGIADAAPVAPPIQIPITEAPVAVPFQVLLTEDTSKLKMELEIANLKLAAAQREIDYLKEIMDLKAENAALKASMAKDAEVATLREELVKVKAQREQEEIHHQEALLMTEKLTRQEETTKAYDFKMQTQMEEGASFLAFHRTGRPS